MIIDGENLILGRTASIVAKKLLNGESIIIINAEKMVITGNEKDIFERFKHRLELKDLANPKRGPKYPKSSERIVKRSVRGMIPYKKPKGRKALKKLRIYVGTPEDLKDHEVTKLKDAELNKEKSLKYITIKKLSKYLGS
ncbi:MAG: 50S ribosomal protein L13 [Methanomicrobia archaeon]|jgi:large subunit ribosomal protein L13|nr:50S ribosomal protein L13 [Methanomicrobia archaeon]MCK4432683.1 50S ribosomal protein L13 [Methanomicrobia archaeon]